MGLIMVQGALGAVAQDSCCVGLSWFVVSLFSCGTCDSIRLPWPCCPDNASVLSFYSTRALEQARPCLVSLVVVSKFTNTHLQW